jgi:phosphate/sulfate permease
MPALPEFNYIFALGIVFAFLDAFNIGANDVANAFSTSVSSRSLTLRQAALIATFCEVATLHIGLTAVPGRTPFGFQSRRNSEE